MADIPEATDQTALVCTVELSMWHTIGFYEIGQSVELQDPWLNRSSENSY